MTGYPPGVVTPEAVVLQLNHAGPGSRILARGLDWMIQVAALIAFSVALSFLGGGSGGTAAAIAYLIAVPLILLG